MCVCGVGDEGLVFHHSGEVIVAEASGMFKGGFFCDADQRTLQSLVLSSSQLGGPKDFTTSWFSGSDTGACGGHIQTHSWRSG